MQFRYQLFFASVVLLLFVVLYIAITEIGFDTPKTNIQSRHTSNIRGKVTIRVNTYRRLDLLETFLDFYNQCEVVDKIQVVWSDQENKAPFEWLPRYHHDKVVFEIHANNSLTNRFKPLLPIPTEAVLSIDDDLIVPCADIEGTLAMWVSNRRNLVGYTPRMHANDIYTGDPRYLRWQHTWWNGVYSIMLTKVAYLHRDYVLNYSHVIPKAMDDYIDKHRNCEDLAMAHVVAVKTEAAPVWVRGTVFETSSEGISSSAAHFVDRGVCLKVLRELTSSWPWIPGYQRLLKISSFDSVYLYDD